MTEQVNEELATEFQQEVLHSVELLWTAAQNKKGRGFNPEQINHIAGYLNSLSVALMQHEKAKAAYDVMLEAYIAEHGREIFDKISGGNVVEGEVIDGNLLGTESSEGGDEEHGTEQLSEGERQGGGDSGLDSSSEGEE